MTTTVEQAQGLKNPYLEVFLKYMEPSRRYGWLEWCGKTDWHHTDGYGGAKWERHMDDVVNTMYARTRLTALMAYSVPTTEAIESIAALSPIVEMGAGTGYWAWMLQQADADVIAFDKDLTDNGWVDDEIKWTEVRQGTEATLGEYSDRALLLCWPPYDDEMALNCLYAYEGTTFIYVGEYEGGCCATDSFFHELDLHWKQDGEYSLPQWEGLHDYVSVWRR